MKDSNDYVTVICGVVYDGSDYNITPFATFFDGNPYDMVDPPGEE